MKWNPRAFVVTLLALAAGIGVLVYRGPGVGWVRGYLGDIAIIVFLVAGFASVGIGSPRGRLVGVGAFALAVELWQGLGIVAPDAPFLVHLTVGSTFDPVDLAFYGVGLLVAAAAQRADAA